MSKRRRYGFVVPRFGMGVAGGAETLVARLASRLAARGDDVLVLTTCALDNRTWENQAPAGEFVEGGVRGIRFAVDARDLERWIPLQIQISEGMIPSVEDQLLWMEHSVNASELYRYLARHERQFDAFLFAPYLFGTTFWGSLSVPSRAVLIPCLHDEQYAYVDIIASMFRQVRGALFNALPEQQLANALYGEVAGGEVGMGFDPPEEVETLEPYFDDGVPYLLYVGRKETGKNVQLLIDHFVRMKETHPSTLRLVIAGGGSFADLHRPQALERDDVIDIGHVSERDKARLIRHAQLLCQPSVNESFSIVLMEAWQLGTPVLVHGRCAVTRYHVTASGGGLYFSGAEDFAAVVQELTRSSELRERLAQAGARYVAQRYSWDAVLARFDQVMSVLLQDAPARQRGPSLPR